MFLKRLSLKNYKSIIFDCDGVLLNSNKLKTNSFFEVTKRFGLRSAQKLVDYHVKNGGISRNKKFKYFVEDILNKNDDNLIDKLIYNYGAHVKNKLLSCEIIPDLKQVIQKNFQKSNKYIVSGGNQEELRFIFKKRKLDYLFNSGIFGSPDSKEKILNREIQKKENFFPALYFGDSKYDYEVAFLYKIDFIFCYEWTEFLEWKSFCYENKVKYIKNINELIIQSD